MSVTCCFELLVWGKTHFFDDWLDDFFKEGFTRFFSRSFNVYFFFMMMVTNWLCFSRCSISLIFLLIVAFITVFYSLSSPSTDLFDLCSIRIVSIILLFSHIFIASSLSILLFRFFNPMIDAQNACFLIFCIEIILNK